MSKVEVYHNVSIPSDDGSTVATDVPVKYQGTVTDCQDMAMLGKKQVLKRQFGFASMMGFASTVIVAWEFVLLTAPFTLEDGGTPGIFWGLILSPIFMMPIYASLAEAASMSPTAGGWLIALGWQAYLCGGCFVSAGLIVGLAKLNAPDYEIQSWQTTLLTIGIVVFCAAFNTYLSDRLPLMESLAGILHVIGVFVVIIPLWVTAPHGNVHETIFVFADNGGWGNLALSATIGIAPMVGMLIGYDASIHMSEEVNDASRTIPKVMIWGVSANAVLVLAIGITFVFCLGDVKSVLDTPTEQPVIQVFFNATKSHVGTTIMIVVIVLVLTSCAIGQVAVASRQIWSFSRDKGFPGFSWLGRIAPRYNLPLNAIVVTAIVTTLLSLINIGSYEAFNAFNSLGSVSILFSYTMSIGCLTWRRLFGAPLPPRRWSLGKHGLWINIVSLCFIIPLLFFYLWPLTYPVTTENMNWSSPMFAGVLSIALIYYLVKGRRDYEGPVAYVKRDL